MEIARAESGKAGIALEPVDLRVIVADMVELYAPLAEEKGLAIDAALERRARSPATASSSPNSLPICSTTRWRTRLKAGSG